jgi:hypothetical protein
MISVQVFCIIYVHMKGFNSFIFLHKQVKIKCQHNDKNYIDGEKGHTELVSSSLKLIARKIGKRRHFFRLLAELKPYANNHKNILLRHHN